MCQRWYRRSLYHCHCNVPKRVHYSGNDTNSFSASYCLGLLEELFPFLDRGTQYVSLSSWFMPRSGSVLLQDVVCERKKISSSLLCEKVVTPVFHCTSSSWPSICNCHSYKHFGSCHFQLRAVRMLVKLANQCQERLGWNDSAHTFFSVLCKTTSVLANWTY